MSNTVNHGTPQVTVYSDASLTGWGEVLESVSTAGHWSEEESRNHINYLEILACFLTLKAFRSRIHNCHVKAMIDNTPAISYVNNMGVRNPECNQITRDLWMWCAGQGIWVTAVHIPGKQNVSADKGSREKD